MHICFVWLMDQQAKLLMNEILLNTEQKQTWQGLIELSIHVQ